MTSHMSARLRQSPLPTVLPVAFLAAPLVLALLAGCPTGSSDNIGGEGDDDDSTTGDDDDSTAGDDDDSTAGDDDDSAFGDDDDSASGLDLWWEAAHTPRGVLSGSLIPEAGPPIVATIADMNGTATTAPDGFGDWELTLSSWEPAQVRITSTGQPVRSVATSEESYVLLPDPPTLYIGDPGHEGSFYEVLFGAAPQAGTAIVYVSLVGPPGTIEGNGVSISPPAGHGPVSILKESSIPGNTVPPNVDTPLIGFGAVTPGTVTLTYEVLPGVECWGPGTVEAEADVIVTVFATCTPEGVLDGGP